MLALEKKPPVVAVTGNRKIRCQVMRSYYENKIRCLIDLKLPPNLVLLACWDAPVEREDLSSESGRKKFMKRCLKFYQSQVKRLDRETNRLG